MSDSVSGGSVKALQKQLNESKVKHAEALYFVQLELDTTRKAKEAVEDRMAELYRDMEELQGSLPQNAETSSKVQIEKYERMLRIMNNQIALVRDSSDSIIKSLKDEISDLMDEKVKSELRLMNQLSDLDREKGKLQRKLSSDDISTGDRSAASSVNRGDKSKPPQPPRRHKSIVENDNDTTTSLKTEILRLRLENKELRAQSMEKIPESNEDADESDDETAKTNTDLESELEEERAKAKKNLEAWTKQKVFLEERIESLKKTANHSMSEPRLASIQEHRDQVAASMNEVAVLWDSADEAVQSIDRAMTELKSHHTEEAGQVLSVLETTSLVQSQIKVALMLIELRFRNNLACLENEKLALDGYAQCPNEIRQQIEKMKTEALESVKKLGLKTEARIEDLKGKAVTESTSIREMHESKVTELKHMLKHQKKLEAELAKLRKQKGATTNESGNPVEMLMSKKALETLQQEVLSVVQKVNEKNETIGRLNAVIEEHKVRERSLMEELRRHIKDQADRQLLEQQRIMEQNAQYHDTDTEDRSLGSDGSFEEQTIDETYYEQTVYEEETVL